MMRKRPCGSPDPKTRKRGNMPQQTEAVEKPAEKDGKVKLDFLVLEKIASLTRMVQFAPDFCPELVSSTFARALHSYYSSEKLNLSIGEPSAEDLADEIDNDNFIPLTMGAFYRRWIRGINVKKENLHQTVEQIFTRFPQINLKLRAENNEYIASAICDALNIARDVTIKRLKVESSFCDIIRCHELIEKLSGNLQVLNVEFLDLLYKVEDEPLSEKFWRAVSSCAALVKLSAMFVEDPQKSVDNFLLVHVANCLGQIKVKRFQTKAFRVSGINSEIDWLAWLLSALRGNETLRQLDLGCSRTLDDFDDMPAFSLNEDASLVLRQLDSLKIGCKYELDLNMEYSRYWQSYLDKILPALSDHAVLKVFVRIYGDYGESPNFVGSILSLLKFYLKLSHEAARSIKLRLLVGKNALLNSQPSYSYYADCGDLDDVSATGKDAELLNRALNYLSSVNKNEFRGLTITPFGSWTRILFGNGSVMVKTQIIEDWCYQDLCYQDWDYDD